ncbi:hypothetical protein [Cysteiniphilum litorale]|uniref:hypothetical protein n=1 Tax=Cysteiniphilum litorale TaxID=2056700 RepID=UPI003F882DFA
MKTCIKLIAVATALASIQSGFANCSIKQLGGTTWNPTITFSCDQKVNLTQDNIEFDISQGNVNGVWNFVVNGQNMNADGISSQLNRRVTIDIGKHYHPEDDVIIQAGDAVTFNYSPTVADAQITNFSVGEKPIEQGFVSFKKSQTSQSIPSNAIILLKDKDGDIAYQTTWQQVSQQNLAVKPGTYQVESYIEKDQQHIPISISSANPVTVQINKTAEVILDYQQQDLKLHISLDHAQPADVKSNNIEVKVTNKQNNSDVQTVKVNWGSSVAIDLKTNTNYTLSAADIIGQQNSYQFTFTPSDINTSSAVKDYYSNIKVSSTPIQTYKVIANVNGLPQDKTTQLSINQNGQTVLTQTIHNGQDNSFNLQSGTYKATATTLIDGDYQYTLAPVNFTVNKQGTNTLTLQFNKEKVGSHVRGWPNYIAMGAVTDANTQNPAQLKGRLVDAIFKYAGNGGNGDRGRLVYPIFTQNTYKLANELSTLNKLPTRPVMVVYTAEMSGGTSFEDFKNNTSTAEIDSLILTKHFINLMLLSQVMQLEHDKYKLAGSIILNPDLMGMIQQQKLYQSLLGTNPTHIDVDKALQQAYWFIHSQHDWQIQLNNDKTLDVKATTPIAVIQMAENGEFKDQGIYSPWDIKVPWENAATGILKQYQSSNSEPSSIPVFSENFKGWVQATNWVVKTFAPSITFGWQENVWNANSANWVHADLSPVQVQDTISKPTVELWQQAGLYHGQNKPDFLVFDKYERNPIPGEAGSGYIWNARDWDNYLTYVKQMSQGLDNIPVMLWQIPGGHLQTTSESTAITHGATGPDFFLGNPDVEPDLSNLQSYIRNINLADATYNCQRDNACQLPDYLKDLNGSSNYDWNKDNMDKARASNVFAILWGGGSTTSVGTFPMDDGGWLAKQVNRYQSQQQH